MSQPLRATIAERLARLRPGMVRWVQARTGCFELAEEVVQQALLRALEQQQTLRDSDRLAAWFKTIVSRGLSDELKRQQRFSPLTAAPEPSTESELPTNGCACVLQVIKQVKPAYAEVMTAVDLHDQSLHHAAEQLGLSPNNASVRLHRARQALRKKLKQVCGTESVAGCLDCGCKV